MIFCGFAIMRWNRKIGVGFRHTHYISLVMLIPTYFGFYFEKCWKKYVCMDIYMDILNCLNVIDLHIWYLSLAAQAKKIYAAAVAEIPNSVRVWCAAANLEREKKSKRRVYQKALENIPNAVRLWKASVWNLGHSAPGRAGPTWSKNSPENSSEPGRPRPKIPPGRPGPKILPGRADPQRTSLT